MATAGKLYLFHVFIVNQFYTFKQMYLSYR